LLHISFYRVTDQTKQQKVSIQQNHAKMSDDEDGSDMEERRPSEALDSESKDDLAAKAAAHKAKREEIKRKREARLAAKKKGKKKKGDDQEEAGEEAGEEAEKEKEPPAAEEPAAAADTPPAEDEEAEVQRIIAEQMAQMERMNALAEEGMNKSKEQERREKGMWLLFCAVVTFVVMKESPRRNLLLDSF